MQLYFVDKDKEQIEKQLATIREKLDEIRATKMGFEKNVAEKQKLAKELHREKLQLEGQLAKEVLKLIAIYTCPLTTFVITIVRTEPY